MEKQKNLKFSLRLQAVLEKAVVCPLGAYYVNAEKGIYYFEPVEGMDRDMAGVAATVMAAAADALGVKSAEVVGKIYELFGQVDEKYVKKEGDKYIVDAIVEGKLEPLVKTSMGTMYGNNEYNCYYFESAHSGFLRGVELKNFSEGLKRDSRSNNEETRKGALTAIKIISEWVELDPEDIVVE